MREKMQRMIGKERGGRTAFAKRCGVTSAYITDVMNGRRYPGPKLAKAIGFEQVIMFKQVAEISDAGN